jgi:hypothetical protein
LRVLSVADQQGVAARGDGRDGRISDCPAVGHRTHLEVIAQEHPAEAESLAQRGADEGR